MTSKKEARAARLKLRAVPRRLTPEGAIPDGAKRCIAKARSGERCKSAPLHGKKKCAFHTGNTAAELGARGGRRRAIFNPEGLEPFAAPKDAGDLLLLLAQTIVEVRSGKVDSRVANTIGYVGAAPRRGRPH
jgi:hypothetical protein